MSPAFLLPNTFFQVLDVECNPQAPSAVRVRFTLGGGREKALTLAQLYQEVLTTPSLTLTSLGFDEYNSSSIPIEITTTLTSFCPDWIVYKL